MAWDGRWRRGHGDGASGGAPASSHALRLLTKLEQRQRGDAGSFWEDGGAAVVTNGWLSEVWRGYGDGGGGEELGCCCGEEMKMVSTGGSGRTLGS